MFFKLAIIVQATETEKPKILFKDVWIYPFCYYYTGTVIKIITKKFMVWIQNRKGKKKIQTITFCQQHFKEIMIRINLKNYCEMLMSERRHLKGRTLTEYALVQLEFSKPLYKAIP